MPVSVAKTGAGDCEQAGSRPGGRGTFLCVAKEKYPKERRPDGLGPSASLRATSGARSKRGLARTRPRLRQSRSLIRFDLRSSAQPDGWGMKTNIQIPIPNSHPESLKRVALQGRQSQPTVMFARERSTRGQMKLPVIAQRGEGGAGGREWGVQCQCLLQRHVLGLASDCWPGNPQLVAKLCCTSDPTWIPDHVRDERQESQKRYKFNSCPMMHAPGCNPI
jgi:hypothetical protein